MTFIRSKLRRVKATVDAYLKQKQKVPLKKSVETHIAPIVSLCGLHAMQLLWLLSQSLCTGSALLPADLCYIAACVMARAINLKPLP